VRACVRPWFRSCVRPCVRASVRGGGVVLLTAHSDVLHPPPSKVAASNGRLKVINVVGIGADQPPIEGWDGELGWVDQPKIEKFCHKPSEDMKIFVCGLPGLYAAMCGPREEKEVAEGTVLAKLGYTRDMVVKF
jgi:hypothetical protein